MSRRLAQRLNASRQNQFVGRDSEIALFHAALTAHELPFNVFYLFGPGGIGKTTLMHTLIALAGEAQIATLYLDARNLEPTPESFLNALQMLLALQPDVSPIQTLAERSERLVIFLDTYELIAPLDHWLSSTFLPQLSDNILIVIAGRRPLSHAWQADPGWRSLIRVAPLRNLSPDESIAYLHKAQVPAEQYERILTFTHGHPLALSLVADMFAQRQDVSFQPESTPDIIRVLVEQLARKVPGPAHRAALEACAMVRLMTEAILAEMLGIPDVHDLFAWLRSLSFVETGPLGIFPHDLAREALAADLRWRNPDWYAELHKRARTYYVTRLQQTHGLEQQRYLFDLIFLHRDNPAVRPYFEWQASGSSMAMNPLRPTDEAGVLALIEKYEGPESARLAAHWIKRQPTGALVVREAGAEETDMPAGLLILVTLPQISADDAQIDPAAGKAWDYVQRHAPLRPGETATFFRFWMARDTYQSVSPVQSLLFVTIVRHYLTTPGLVYTIFPCLQPDFWLGVLTYADLLRIPELDFRVGNELYGIFGHNWRTTPPLAWLMLLGEREIANTSVTPPPPPVAPLMVLSEAEFANAVRDALHDLTRPNLLQANPLLRSRVVTDQVSAQAGQAERISVLQTLLKEAAGAMQQTPRDVKFYRVLYHTYLHPAPTQEQAAELLDLPFSTYRRHLKTALERVNEVLWQREIGGLTG